MVARMRSFSKNAAFRHAEVAEAVVLRFAPRGAVDVVFEHQALRSARGGLRLVFVRALRERE